MKLFYTAVFVAVLSVPLGVGSVQLFLAYALHPSLPYAVGVGAVVSGLVLVLSFLLFLVSLFTMKPRQGVTV